MVKKISTLEEIKRSLRKEIIQLGMSDFPSLTEYRKKYTRGRVLGRIKERLHQELLNNLSGLENVDGEKLLKDLLEIFNENNM